MGSLHNQIKSRICSTRCSLMSTIPTFSSCKGEVKTLSESGKGECGRGGGDILRQLHDLAEAESKLQERQKWLAGIEAQKKKKKEVENMAYAAMKPTKAGLEEPLEQIHKIRITLSSKNVKNLEKCV